MVPVITLYEKMLVPGDYVHYEILHVASTWQGPPVKKQPPPIPLIVEGAKQVGHDPHKETLDKISSALGSLMDKKLGAVIPTSDLLKTTRHWR